MHYSLTIDVAKSKSMVSLINSSSDVLIKPLKLIILLLILLIYIIESINIYHKIIEKYFLENNFKVYVINSIYEKIYIFSKEK